MLKDFAKSGKTATLTSAQIAIVKPQVITRYKRCNVAGNG